MPPLPGSPGFLRVPLSGRSAGLLRLYQQGAEQAGLLPTDFYTVHDLLDLSDYSDREPLHALLLAMILALNEGSLCVEASEDGLTRRLADLVSEEEARTWARRILEDLHKPSYPRLIGECVEDGKPIILHPAGGRIFLYFQRHLKHEAALCSALRQRLAPGQLVPLPGDLGAVLKDILVDHPLYLGGRPVQLNRDQCLAVGLSLLRNCTIISGGPGTGKTSVVCTLVRCLVHCSVAPERIALAAPTGRAAQRMTDALRAGLKESIGRDGAVKDLVAHTLHHLLGYRPTLAAFRHHAENQLPADVVIVDEVSMVGLDLMAALLQAIRSDTRLILLGDKDQLPSVQAGAVLAHLIPEDGCAHFGTELSNGLRAILPDLDVAPAAGGHRLQDVLVVLQENYRSQREIQEAARAVNGLDTALVDRLPRFNLSNQGAGPKEKAEDGFVSCSFAELEQRGGCWLSEPATDSLAGWRSFLTSWAEHHFLSAMVKGTTYQELVAQYRVSEHQEIPLAERAVLDQLFTLLGRARILTLLREGFWGSGGVNRLLGQFLGPHLDARGGVNLFAGAPVLITRNDPSRGLFNGDIGIALRCGTSSRRVVFQRQDGYVSLPVDVLPTHEPAFALTVHKSQGGEYGQVLLVLPPEGGRGLLTRELIYTGITRARQLAIIYGTAEMLRTAISRRIKRESALLAYQS